MATQTELPVEQRILQVLQHLGVEKAHFAAQLPRDWQGLAANHPEVISSLTLVCPRGLVADSARGVSSQLLVVTGDRGDQAQAVQRALAHLPNAQAVVLPDYINLPWSDVIADRGEEVFAALMRFLPQGARDEAAIFPAAREGEVAGVTYRVQGSGPPLVLLPLGLAASQWVPVLTKLSRNYCAILLGGPQLGMVVQLEARARGCYQALRRTLVDELELQVGESILDIGCGTGAHDRWLARHTNGSNPITAVDINAYLLREARNLARKEGLDHAIEFREGDAEALPFADNSFDAVMSITVMEEVNADRMMAEMFRVAKPGGRVGVLVRSVDLPQVLNLPLLPELKQKLEAPGAVGAGVEEDGCADASLYRRFRQAGLTRIKMLPQLGVFSDKAELEYQQSNILATLNDEEAEKWRAAAAQAEAEGTMFIARPFHCAVGTKPG